jgi:hypothetical protein
MTNTVFRELYGSLKETDNFLVREKPGDVPEHTVQALWYDQAFTTAGLSTLDGRSVNVISPGWWNHGEGPDFKGAQIEFNGRLRNGDVEIHVHSNGWTQHGHHLDSRYDQVILHIVLDSPPPGNSPTTSSGKQIPEMNLMPNISEDLGHLTRWYSEDSVSGKINGTLGRCANLVEGYGPEALNDFIHFAGEWRMLFKAREMRQRMDNCGMDQAVYESIMYACGYSHFKHHFKTLARQLPYDRARQLGAEDALLLEAAYSRLTNLMPENLPEDSTGLSHWTRMNDYLSGTLEGLRPLPLEWKRVGVRPVNYPERRLAGASRLVSRTSKNGLTDTIDTLWKSDLAPLALRREFESLFPTPMGFWASHCTWTGKPLASQTALIGQGRIRSIIGNVFIPLGLALARQHRNRPYEERVYEFFGALPKEPENHIQKAMVPRLFGMDTPYKLDFRKQQGILQIFNDWCEPNPSCQNCKALPWLESSVEQKSRPSKSNSTTGTY